METSFIQPSEAGNTESILGFPVYSGEKEDLDSLIRSWLSEPPTSDDRSKFFVCLNPHSWVTAMDDEEFRQSIEAADLVLPDGIGMVLASWIAGGRVHRRISGYDAFTAVSTVADSLGLRILFLGSSPSVLAGIGDRYRREFPRSDVVGLISPPYKTSFGERDMTSMVDQINRAKPDICWVGLGAPKQEKWVHSAIGRLNVRMVGPIGAVFDYYCDRSRPSPLIRSLGLEWAERLARDPVRMWRRTIFSAPRFVMAALRGRI